MSSYNQLPFLQELNLTEINNALGSNMNEMEKARLLYAYSTKFLMTPHYWIRLIHFLEDVSADPDLLVACRTLALSQFYSLVYGNRQDKHIKWNAYPETIAKCQTYEAFPEGIMELEEALTFPHQFLQQCFHAYGTLSARPISKELHRKFTEAKRVYAILDNSELDFNDEWFEALESTNDREVIIMNFEYFLGRNYSCQKLWRHYINYHRKHNSLAMLNIYRRYCRFFIGDLKMNKEYLQEIESVGKKMDVADFLGDLVDFELEVSENLEAAKMMFDKALMATLKHDLRENSKGGQILEYCRIYNSHQCLYQRQKSGNRLCRGNDDGTFDGEGRKCRHRLGRKNGRKCRQSSDNECRQSTTGEDERKCHRSSDKKCHRSSDNKCRQSSTGVNERKCRPSSDKKCHRSSDKECRQTSATDDEQKCHHRPSTKNGQKCKKCRQSTNYECHRQLSTDKDKPKCHRSSDKKCHKSSAANDDEKANFKKIFEEWQKMMEKRRVALKNSEPKPEPQECPPPSPIPKFNASTRQKQAFSLPLSSIYQILGSAKPETLMKLFQSCKSLFHFHSTPLCHQLGANDAVQLKYFQQSLFIPSQKLNLPGLNRLHIVNSIDWIIESNRKALSKFIPRLHQCSAKFIHIDCQDLTIPEFQFLTSNAQILHLCNTNILKADGTALSRKEIRALTPGMIHFDFHEF